MKEKYWEELLQLFLDMPVIQESHKDLFKNIKLIVETTKKHKELEELNKELTELNK